MAVSLPLTSPARASISSATNVTSSVMVSSVRIRSLTLIWGANAKDGAPPVPVEDAHPAIVSRRDFQKARRLLGSRAPKKVNPRRASSPYLLSGIASARPAARP